MKKLFSTLFWLLINVYKGCVSSTSLTTQIKSENTPIAKKRVIKSDTQDHTEADKLAEANRIPGKFYSV